MPSMSPRTQQMQAQQGAGIDQQTALFEKGFSQMSYNVLLNKLPDLVENVVTFKILDTDADEGTAIGAFILKRHDQALYVPVVMAENHIKPLELVYHKALNIFLPLSKGWLDELDKTSIGELGQGVKTPDTLESDVNIRDVVVPPLTGRFSYAAFVENPGLFNVGEVAEVLGEKTAGDRPKMLLDLLLSAPNKVKLGFAKALERSPKLLKQAAAVYGISGLTEALRLKQEKRAYAVETPGSLWIADHNTKPDELRRVFGNRAADAFSGVRLKGYAAHDTRRSKNIAVQLQPYSDSEQPNQAGVYTLYRPDGKEERAFVIPHPLNPFFNNDSVTRHGTVPGHRDPLPRTFPLGRIQEHNTIPPSMNYLAILANGDFMETNRLGGSSFVPAGLEGSGLFKKLFSAATGEPKRGRGIFVRPKGIGFQGTVPMEITDITTGSDGVRRINAKSIGGWDETVLITAPKTNLGYNTPKGAGFTILPTDFIWIPVKERLKHGDLIRDPLDINKFVANALGLIGVGRVNVKNAGAQQFSINGQPPMDRIAALKKLASAYHLDCAEAEVLLEKAASEYTVEFYPVSITKLAQLQMQLTKVADDSGKKKDSDKKPAKKPPAGDEGGDEGEMDPDMMAQMQASMQPPAPPPPSPSDLAAMEMQHQIEAEMQKLQERAQMLQQLTQRTQEIAGGAPVAPPVQSAAMGAPPPSMNLATGQPMDPSAMGGMGGQPGMDPSMMGGQPGMGGAPGGMDPSIMGGAPGGMDPSIMGGAPGGMDPSMMGGAAGGGMDPSMMGGQPGMDPSMMGGAPGGMDPSMMGGAPGGMDPSMMGGQPGDPSMGGLEMAGMNPAMGGAPGGPGMPGAPQMPSAMITEDGLTEQDIAQQVNPAFLDQAAQLQSEDVFDAAAVANLAQSPAIKDLVGQYVPNLEKALDNLGRVLLSLWMQESTLKSEIGEDTYADLEDNLRTTFKNLGDLVLRLNQSAHTIRGKFDRDPISQT